MIDRSCPLFSCHFPKDQDDFYARFDGMNRYCSTKGGGGGGGEGGITSYYILLQHLHIYFSSEDEILFSRFKSEMDRLKVMNF